MAFYNSGIKRLFKKKNLNTERNTVEIEQLKKNEALDDATVAGITSFPGFGTVAGKALQGNTTTITAGQIVDINNNSSARVKQFEKVLTWPEWIALTNILTTGYDFVESGAPNLRTDQILAIRMETYNPGTEVKTPSDLSGSLQILFNPAGSFGTSVVDNILFRTQFYGTQMDNEPGVHICQGTNSGSYSKSGNTECNMNISEAAVERLSMKIVGGLTEEDGLNNKMRLVVTYITSAAFNYS